MSIQRILCNPPLCVARLGASTVPSDAFSWVASEEPHLIGETQLRPEWSLDVQSDGTVVPRKPDRLTLRDEGRIRPVAPFIEIWCDLGSDGDAENWTRQPLTEALLAAEGLSLAAVSFRITAMNRKASRRAGNPALRYGTFPPVEIAGDDHAPKPLRGVSPPVAAGQAAMIPAGRFILLGSVQVIRPKPQPAAADGVLWAEAVKVDTLRLRVTPAPGAFYGPPGSDQVIEPPDRSGGFSAVPAGNTFLDAAAGWAGARAVRPRVTPGQPAAGLVVPGDTYDGAEADDQRSLGIVDDTCEMLIEVTLARAGGPALAARANVFCGPPDYAPDRRPFLSLADELNDRACDKASRSEEIANEELDRWVEDLFERAYETVSLFNVDLWRRVRAAELIPGQRRAHPIPDDATRDPDSAMSGEDALRDGNIALFAPSPNAPLPLSVRAHERHRDLSDLFALKAFVREHPARLAALLRPPFTRETNENADATTMRMPPFMRNSDAEPLTLSEWQYALLMDWQHRVQTTTATLQERARLPERLSDGAEARRARVLRQLGALNEAP